MTISVCEPPTTAVDELIDDRYRLVDLIGRGAHSHLWSALDVRLGRTVALKLFAPPATVGIRTAQALAAPASACVDGMTRVFDVATDVDLHGVPHTVVARELAGGQNLAAWAGSGPPSAAVAAVGAGIATTLAALHGLHVAHGSVTSANIIVGGDHNVVLTDFGVRQLLTDRAARPDQDVRQLGLTLLGAMVGREIVGSRGAQAALGRLRQEARLRRRESHDWAAALGSMLEEGEGRPTAATVATAFTALSRRTAPLGSTLPERGAAVDDRPPWEILFSEV